VKVGDYVYIKQGVHDDRMPSNRRDCLILEIVGQKKDQALVMFSNKAFLKFHVSQLVNLHKT
jgi:hypothetical protein